MKKSGNGTIILTSKIRLYFYFVVTCLTVAVLSFYSYVTHPYSRLKCVRHERPNKPNHDISGRRTSDYIDGDGADVREEEDNDCAILRTFYSSHYDLFFRNHERPFWILRNFPTKNLRGSSYADFVFEVEKVFVGIARFQGGQMVASKFGASTLHESERKHLYHRLVNTAASGVRGGQKSHQIASEQKAIPFSFDYMYYVVNGDGTIWPIQNMSLDTVDKGSHQHLFVLNIDGVQKGNETEISDSFLSMLSQETGYCEMAVLVQSNIGRLYNFFEFEVSFKFFSGLYCDSFFRAEILSVQVTSNGDL